MSELENTARDALRRTERELDESTLQRLTGIRTAALASRRRLLPRFALPAVGGLAVAAVVGVLVLLPAQAPPEFGPVETAQPQLAENPEFYRDLDFYLWLSESEMGKRG